MKNSLLAVLRASIALSLVSIASPGLRAQTQLELGKMWTFENPPLAYLEEEYGFAPGQEWLDQLRMASLRFGSWCSASFVSPKGLIMTNHHCVRGNIEQSQPRDQDWLENGFYAASYQDEAPLSGLTVQQLVSMKDVTDQMLAGIGSGDDDVAAEAKRARNEERILEEAAAMDPDHEAEIVTLHQGARFALYVYKVYSDIRLVCAPHLQSAYFGGDPDNFTYPRYCLDFSFCRAYENGEPADTSGHYFRWSKTGAKEGELVFVTGNPGSTGRLLTYSQMEFLRDVEYPIQLAEIKSRLQVLRYFASLDPEMGKRFLTLILGDENSVKALTGYLAGLLDEKLMARKKEMEAELRAKVEADPELAAKYGDVWDKLEEIGVEKTELGPKLAFQTPQYHRHLARALAVVTAVDPETDEREQMMARQLIFAQPFNFSPVAKSLFLDHLNRAHEWLAADDPYLRAVVGDRGLEDAIEYLATSQVSDDGFCSALIDGGMDAVAASDDPAIVAARAIMPLVVDNQKIAERIDAAETVQNRRIGRALFACYGDKISPDATMTLRFSDGIVDGYRYNGTVAPYRTTFYGMYGRNIEFDNEFPFNQPSAWLDGKDSVDMNKAVNFVSTNDIIGGNSGSPVVDKDLQVVGLIFDGNIEQLPNRFLFRADVERSVSVHVDAMIEAMKKIYGADRVVEELGGE